MRPKVLISQKIFNEAVVRVPHIASASRETRLRMATMAAENLVAGLTGRRPPNLVNEKVLEKV